MFPPVFAIAAADPAVKAVLGSNPVRLFPFGRAPQGVTVPYATWRVVGGEPDTYLAGRPDSDTFRTQIDVFGSTPTQARAAAAALIRALELDGNVVSFNVEETDDPTGYERYSFDWEHITPR